MDTVFSLAGTSASPTITITPAAGIRYYLVVGVGSDGVEGPVGHYGR